MEQEGGHDAAQNDSEYVFVGEGDVAKGGALDSMTTCLDMPSEGAASPPLSTDYDSDSESFCFDRFSDAELEEYAKQAKWSSLLKNSQHYDASSHVSNVVCWESRLLEELKGAKDHKSSEFAGNLTNFNSSHLQPYSTPLQLRSRSSSDGISCQSNTVLQAIIPTSFSSLTLGLNQNKTIEGSSSEALSKLTTDQQIAVAGKHTDEAKKILVMNYTMDGRSNALEPAADWNEVKADAQGRRNRSLATYSNPYQRENPAERHDISTRGTSTAPLEQGSPATSISAKERMPIRKRLSGFFKKTTAPSGANLTSKSTVSLGAPAVNTDNALHCTGMHSHKDPVNDTIVNVDLLHSDDAITLFTSRSELASDRDEALQVNHDAPPMPHMPPRPNHLAEPGTPEVKRNHRNVHIIGTSPDHAVIMNNTKAFSSPDKRHYRQRAGTSKSTDTRSDHDHWASTPKVVDKQPKNPFDKHINHSASDQDDIAIIPTRERRFKTAKVAKKRLGRRSIFRKAEPAADFDEDDSTTPTKNSFDAAAYSGDEDSVHTAKAVRMAFQKASLVDIPARRGKKYPATINKHEPKNMALFSNPPNKNTLRIELEAQTKKAQEAQLTAGDAMRKRTDSVSTSLKTKPSLTNLKTVLKGKENKRDDSDEQQVREQECEKSDNPRGAVVDKQKGGGSGGVGYGTARARMEGY